jgi:broad specificity phosphatase PhoE
MRRTLLLRSLVSEHPIVFIRHGETDWNLQGLIQGSVDTSLNATGLKQAARLANALSAMRKDFDFHTLHVSPQKRARQTMQPIARALERDDDVITLEPKVRELEFGIWEGRPFWELKASPIYPAHPEDRFFWRPEGGESYEDGVARIARWRASLTGPALVVSHGAVGRCLMGAIAGLGPREIIDLKTPQGAWCLLDKGCISWFDADSGEP